MNPDIWPSNEFINSAKGTINFMNTVDRSDIIPITIQEFERWDRIRKENWKIAIPELAFIGDHIG